MARHKQQHISGWLAILLTPIVIPIVIVAKLATQLGLLKGTADLTADDVEGYLQDFVDGRGGEWDWDDFTSIPITDPALDRIREEASCVQLPLTTEGEIMLRGLLEQVWAIRVESGRQSSSPARGGGPSLQRWWRGGCRE